MIKNIIDIIKLIIRNVIKVFHIQSFFYYFLLLSKYIINKE